MNSTNHFRDIKTNDEIKELSLQQLEGKWWPAVAFSLIYIIIISIIDNIPIPGTAIGPFGEGIFWGQEYSLPILTTIFGGVLAIGVCSYFLRIAKNREADFPNMFDGLEQIDQAIFVSIVTGLLTTLGFICFIIPGVIISLGLSQTYYIMADNPGIKGIDAMKQSWEMMDGHKSQLFFLGLSFLPWAILCIFTLFIGFLWLMPYMNVSFSNFYLELKGEEPDDMQIEHHLVD